MEVRDMHDGGDGRSAYPLAVQVFRGIDAAVGADQPAEDVDEGRLAAPHESDDRDELAFVHRQGDVFEHVSRAGAGAERLRYR
jgi:hypothetical protein